MERQRKTAKNTSHNRRGRVKESKRSKRNRFGTVCIVANGAKGAGKALKDFSLPISMSFRMFGALLSGLLVTELVYYYVSLSFVVPVVVGVLFTLLHALIQAYVLTTLTSMFYGETTEKHAPKPKKNKKIKAETVNN